MTTLFPNLSTDDDLKDSIEKDTNFINDSKRYQTILQELSSIDKTINTNKQIIEELEIKKKEFNSEIKLLFGGIFSRIRRSILLLGSRGIGKTSFVYSNLNKSMDYITDENTKHDVIRMKFSDDINNIITVDFGIDEISNEDETWKYLNKGEYQEYYAIMVMYDITDYNSKKYAEKIIRTIKSHSRNKRIIILASNSHKKNKMRYEIEKSIHIYPKSQKSNQYPFLHIMRKYYNFTKIVGLT